MLLYLLFSLLLHQQEVYWTICKQLNMALQQVSAQFEFVWETAFRKCLWAASIRTHGRWNMRYEVLGGDRDSRHWRALWQQPLQGSGSPNRTVKDHSHTWCLGYRYNTTSLTWGYYNVVSSVCRTWIHRQFWLYGELVTNITRNNQQYSHN